MVMDNGETVWEKSGNFFLQSPVFLGEDVVVPLLGVRGIVVLTLSLATTTLTCGVGVDGTCCPQGPTRDLILGRRCTQH